MNFTEAVNNIISIVKRPDKQAQIEQAINASVSFFCLKDHFRNDLIETTVSIDPALFGATKSIAVDLLLSNFRQFKYIKQPSALRYLNKIDVSQIFTPGGIMQKNCYYTAGGNLTYILSSCSATLEVGYYQFPSNLSGTDTHWLLEMYPYCIIDKAAARIFRLIGDETSSRMHEAYAMEAFKVLQNDMALGG